MSSNNHFIFLTNLLKMISLMIKIYENSKMLNIINLVIIFYYQLLIASYKLQIFIESLCLRVNHINYITLSISLALWNTDHLYIKKTPSISKLLLTKIWSLSSWCRKLFSKALDLLLSNILFFGYFTKDLCFSSKVIDKLMIKFRKFNKIAILLKDYSFSQFKIVKMQSFSIFIFLFIGIRLNDNKYVSFLCTYLIWSNSWL